MAEADDERERIPMHADAMLQTAFFLLASSFILSVTS